MDDDLLAKIVRNAFKSGQAWAVTYVSWFSPENSDTDERVKTAIINARRTVERHRVTVRRVD